MGYHGLPAVMASGLERREPAMRGMGWCRGPAMMGMGWVQGACHEGDGLV